MNGSIIALLIAILMSVAITTVGLSTAQTVGDLCATVTSEDNLGLLLFCEEFKDVSLDESIDCGDEEEDEADGPLESFTVRSILGADDPQAALNATLDRCHGKDRRQGKGRQLAFNWGWCSASVGMILGGSDSANYCAPSQPKCNGWGCNTQLSTCCITHDKCLQKGKVGGRCKNNPNCDGLRCDFNLAACAFHSSCLARRTNWFWNGHCFGAKWGVTGLFVLSRPNANEPAVGDNKNNEPVCNVNRPCQHEGEDPLTQTYRYRKRWWWRVGTKDQNLGKCSNSNKIVKEKNNYIIRAVVSKDFIRSILRRWFF